ncbi:MAG: hypothetical protein QMD36_02980 [Candidatus Aenigmarchaeota archaeon]|nr:hypothetical protein [Candidatus Aenigmarchaeota archaeon]
MKGIMSIIEVMITGMILFVAFLHFFPQYVVRSKWDKALLVIKVRDTLNTIDRLNKTYDFAMDNDEFNDFMNRIFLPEKTGGVVVWWKVVEGDITVPYQIPYFTEGYKESMVDVYNTTTGLKIYSFTIGIGYPY